MAGVSLGYFDPTMIARDVDKFIAAMMPSMPMTSRGFGKTMRFLHNKDGRMGASLMAIVGHVPVHVDKPVPREPDGPQFHFVMRAENRPCLLTAPIKPEFSQIILNPNSRGSWGMGCFELRAGMIVHFDPTKTWHAVSGMPLGVGTGEPEAIIVRIPWDNPREIHNAIQGGREALTLDRAVGDFVR